MRVTKSISEGKKGEMRRVRDGGKDGREGGNMDLRGDTKAGRRRQVKIKNVR